MAHFTVGERLALLFPRALFDELVLRLGVVTALVWLARASGLGGAWRTWPAILAAALLAWPLTVLPYFAQLAWHPATVLREGLLHGAAGALWGWLYCRHGWLAGLAGHWSAQLALQPLLGISS